MASKFQAMTGLFQYTSKEITSNPYRWMSFLNTAASVYKYSFNEQVMIYAQRPDTIACAPLEIWNKKMNRWVNRGATGIALLDDSSTRQRLKYVFDLRDTHLGVNGRTPFIWRMQEHHTEPVLQHLIDTYDLDPDTYLLHNALMEIARNSVLDNMDDYFSDFRTSVKGSFLEELDELNLQVRFRESVIASVQYMLLYRCGFPPDEILDVEDFSFITDFNTLETVAQLGFATNDIAKPILMDIGREIRSIETEIRRSRRQEIPYNRGAEAKPYEGGLTHETELHSNRGLSDSESGDQRTGRSTGQVRNASQIVPEESSGRNVSGNADDWQADTAPAGDRPGGEPPHGSDRSAAVGKESGSEQGSRSAEMGSAHDLSAESGGGDRVDRAGVQVTDTEESDSTEAEGVDSTSSASFVLPVFPSVEKQIAELGVYEAPAMLTEDIPGEVLDDFLRGGSGKRRGQLRMAAFFMADLTADQRAELIASEYGQGEMGIRLMGMDYTAGFDQYGIQITPGHSITNAARKAYVSWEEATERIQSLLYSGTYLPQVVLDNVLDNERSELALNLLYLYHDFNYDNHPFPYFDRELLSGGYPEAQARWEEMLKDPNTLTQQINILQQFHTDYLADHSILRFHHYRIPALLERLQRLSTSQQRYRANEDYVLQNPTSFITEGNIDSFLHRNHYSESRLTIYSYFLQNTDKNARADFLKDHYGTGGISPAPFSEYSSADYDAKGVRLLLSVPNGPEDKLLLKWPKVAERVAQMIANDQWLSREDRDRMPGYTLDYLANSVLTFSALLPDDQRPENLQYPFLSSDESKKNLHPALTDPEQLQSLVSAMEQLYKAIPSDYFRRDTCKHHLEILQTYRDGTFNLFPELKPEEPERKPQTKARHKTEDGQLSLSDFMSIDTPEEAAEEHSSEKEENEDEPVQKEPINETTECESSQTASEETEIPLEMELTIDDRRFRIESVDLTLQKVSLVDLTFLEAMGFPLNRVESVDFIRSWISEHSPAEQENHTEESTQAEQSDETIATEQPASEGTFKPPVEEHPDYPEINFHITDEDLGVGGPKAKFRANVEALRLLDELDMDGRRATPEEQEVLSRYVGWGGLPMAFDETNADWNKEYQELKNLLSPDEYAAARSSTLTAHYTSPVIIQSMYEALENLGFTGGNVLEPSCGTGNFFGCLPQSMAESRLYGVELDAVTGRIASQLYQKADITIDGFEKVDFSDDFFDVVIGNVPFGNYQLADRRYDRQHFLIHDYFLAKSLDKVRPGGIVAVITSSGTMDKQSASTREYLANRADLLGAIRLPNNAFKRNAGTEVVADILFFQKRDHAPVTMPEWVQLGTTEDGHTINQYFVSHPEMVLGNLELTSTQYGKSEVTVTPMEGANLKEQLHKAVQNIQGTITAYELQDSDLESEQVSIPADPSVQNFSYTVVDGDIYWRENSRMNKQELPVATAARVRGMVELREITRGLLNLQLDDASDEQIQAQMALLNTKYDQFTSRFGLITSSGNRRAFNQDASYCLLASLEITDDQGNLIRKADIFSKRTVRKPEPVTSVDTAVEALTVSMGERAHVDLPYMAELYGKNENEICTELRGLIFQEPVSGQWQTADEYLSGNVRQKLRTAETFAANHPEFAINVDHLKKVQPEPISASDITVRLGANWIDPEIVTQFMKELLQTPSREIYRGNIKILYAPASDQWQIKGKSVDRFNPTANFTYGTERVSAYRLLEDALNQRSTKIYDTIIDIDGKERRVVNQEQTILAQQKQDAIKEAFQSWIFRDPMRREALVTIYNERFNCIRPREYDGSFLQFPGMNPSVHLRPHQKNGAAHVIYGNNTLLAHCVGSGKTFTCIASAMESKRLGICQKSLFVVPNHLTGQWGSDILTLYPNAKVLVATKKDFEPANRRKFCSRIATGDYDAVVIGHTQFERIPLSAERQIAYLQRQIDDVVEGIAAIKEQDGERFTIKQMETTRKRLEATLKKLTETSKKDDVVTFEQLGVDRLFVDESQEFKNLYCYTKMSNVAGVATTDAQKSSDLYMKCQYLDKLTGGRGVTFATGTPISNSMTELYTLMRYLQADMLRDMGLQHFDSWAAQFGETVTAIELAPEGTGYRAKTRFSRFFNLPELMSVWKESADIQTSDMLNLPTPTPVYEDVLVKPSPEQQELVASLGDRAERIRNGGVDPSIDNMLTITNDGRKLALDQRLINPMLPDFPDSKVNACVQNIYQIWEETTPQLLTQIVFCDLSTPKGDGSFNVYDDIREKLVARGIPREQVAFIHEASTDAQKEALFAKVRNGQVRVIFGSTFKMGAGTNIQDRLYAMHHLDVPWRPSDVEQQEGRILRQGNINDSVRIFRYLTEGTFDAYMWVRHEVA